MANSEAKITVIMWFVTVSALTSDAICFSLFLLSCCNRWRCCCQVESKPVHLDADHHSIQEAEEHHAHFKDRMRHEIRTAVLPQGRTNNAVQSLKVSGGPSGFLL